MRSSKHTIDLRKGVQMPRSQSTADIHSSTLDALNVKKGVGVEEESEWVEIAKKEEQKEPPVRSVNEEIVEKEKEAGHEEEFEQSIYATDPSQLTDGSGMLSFGDATRPTIKKSDNIIYNSVAGFGRMLEGIGKGTYHVVRITKAVILSPIRLLDFFLDMSAKGVIHVLSLMLRSLRKGIARVIKGIAKYRINPPYFWAKDLITFAIITALVILPIKVAYETPRLINAQQKVLGKSTQAVKYAGILYALRDYVPAAQVAKEFIGFNGPRRVLLVFQNNAELRPTGGFMGSYAVIDVRNGEITSMHVPTGGFYDLKGYMLKQVEAPRPFHIFSPFWQVWNANWFADFPLSSKKLAQFYEWGGGSTVDGIITFTPDVIEDMLVETGPIEMPEYDTVITAENFRRQTQTEVEIEYDQEANTPKAFIADLMPKMLERLFALTEDGSLEAILGILDKGLSEKYILAYSTDPEIQNIISELGWSGEVRKAPKDYVQVVHTNIGGGKTDLVIKDVIQHAVRVLPDGSIIDTITLTRKHTGDPSDQFEGHDNLDYIRFYVPYGSKLLAAEGFTTDDLSDRFKTTDEPIEQDPDIAEIESATLIDTESRTEITTESGKTVFANWLGLKPGQTKTVSISYRLPFILTPEESYSIYWQKQSGTKGSPFIMSVELPDDQRFSNWLPQSANVKLVSDNELLYSNDLRRDRVFSFTMQERE